MLWLNEILLAIPGYDTLFALRETDYMYLNGSITISYDVTSNLVKLISSNTSSGTETIVVSFAFKSMDTEEVTEILSYTWTSFFGDLSGIAGILIGLDLIKITKGMLTVSKAVSKKSVQPIATALYH